MFAALPKQASAFRLYQSCRVFPLPSVRKIAYSRSLRSENPTYTAATQPDELTSEPGLRLLETGTFRLRRPTLGSQHDDRYAILSHTWRIDEQEVTFADLQLGVDHARTKEAFSKLQYTSDQAVQDGLSQVWIDTCCIDKSSSSDLSEAISSMYRWYASASVCYVYLADVDIRDGTSAFLRSRWFTRAWTLQELLAPVELRFYDRTWTFISRLDVPECAAIVSEATGIDVRLLLRATKLSDYSIAQKMSWAARRNAKRPEDRAYSLLGIFDVNMPMLYGEGDRAFSRLQEEIIKSSVDHSIFSWEADGLIARSTAQQLLSTTPSCFVGCHNVVQQAGTNPRPYQMTNRGLEITLPIHSYIDESRHCQTYGRLNCINLDRPDEILALRLSKEYDIDAEGSTSSDMKPWTGVWSRRLREAYDDLMGRVHDWQFLASYARRGFSVGHSGMDSRVLSLKSDNRSAFREQTIVILRSRTAKTNIANRRADTTPRADGTEAPGNANPIATFNILALVASSLLYVLIYLVAEGAVWFAQIYYPRPEPQLNFA